MSPLLTSRALLVLLSAVLLTACLAPNGVRVDSIGFNDKLRPDRGALSPQQRVQRVESLRFGPWRRDASAITPYLLPDDPLAAALPQSDCWALANSESAGRDAVLANWEVIGRVTPTDGDGKPLGDWIDPEDGVLDLGMCRLNDPVTRLAPVTRSGDRSAVANLDCAVVSDAGILGGAPEAFSTGRNFPRCISDAEIYAARLHAQRASTRDAFGRCGAERAAVSGTPIRIGSLGLDFWQEISAHPASDPSDRRLSACMRDAQLIPPTTTRYTLDAVPYAVDAAAPPERVLEPVLQPLAENPRLTRPLSADGSYASWRTRVQNDPGSSGAVRWEENYASSLVVTELRVVRPIGSVPSQAQASIPVQAAVPSRVTQLCIEDADSPLLPAGLRCRYTCTDTDPLDAQLHFRLDDRSCRDHQGRAAAPLVTPTYALDSAQSAISLTPERGLRQPLRWSLDDPGLAGAWIEFGLTLRGTSASMRSGLSVADAGAVRVGSSRRLSFRVDNVGAQTLRVRQIELQAGSAHPQDFRIELPFDPQPVPTGYELSTDSGVAIAERASGFADPSAWFSVREGSSHLRLSTPRNLSVQLGGQSLRRVEGLLWRDVASFPPGWTEAMQPQSENGVLMQSWRPRPLPFVLSAREGFLVSVLATPGALGDRSARLRVIADPIAGGAPVEIQIPLRVRGLNGPLPLFMPNRLVLVAPAAGTRIARNVLLSNDGDTATTLSAAPTLNAAGSTNPSPHANQFRLIAIDSATGSLAPGASRLLRVEFIGQCTGSGSMQVINVDLHWPTANGRVVLPIQAGTGCAG